MMFRHHHRSVDDTAAGRLDRSDPLDPSAESGMVGGLEVLPFGLLVFVAGSLILANAWAVVDAEATVEAAAREATRAYVEAPGPASGRADAMRAAAEVVSGAGRDPGRMTVRIEAGAARCSPVEVTVSYRVPAGSAPFVGSFGDGVTVHGRHRELLDPFGTAGVGEVGCG